MAGAAWLVLPHYSWRFLTIVTALPVFMTCVVSTWLLPESPRWLCVQRRVQEAEGVITAAVQVNDSCSPAYLAEHPILLAAPAAEPREGALVLLAELLSPQHFAVTLPLWTVWACFGAAYYGVLLFTGEMFSSDGSGDDDGDDDGGGSCSFDYAPIFLTAVAEFVGCVMIVRFVDSQGRVRTQGVAYGLGALGCLLMGE